MNTTPRAALLAAVCLATFPAPLAAAEWTVRVTDKAPPASLDASMQGLLRPGAIQLLDAGEPVLELWFVKEVPLESAPASPAKAMDAIRQATLIGACAVSRSLRDYKDNEIGPGVYTMRFGLQPTDGDHLGTSDYPYYAVLIPAKLDLTPGGIDTYRSMTKASGRETASGHPMILSLRPVSSDQEETQLTEPAADHRAIRVKLAGAAGGTSAAILLEFVFSGTGHI